MTLLRKIWWHPKGKWALLILGFFGSLALFADFLANEKPIYCKYEGESYFPIFHDYAEMIGFSKPYNHLQNNSWQDLKVEKAIYPLIQFDAESIAKTSEVYSRPGTLLLDQNKRHWLGSDGIGRDVAAGIIQGSRKTFYIAFFSMLISCIIGFFLGILSGYYGDDSAKVNLWLLLLAICGFGLFLFQWFYGHWSLLMSFVSSSLLFIAIVFLNKAFSSKQVDLPLDIIVMRMIEIFKSIPALFILLALLALIAKPSILSLIILIGFLRWPSIARVLRAELLKIKAKEFVLASRSLGLSDFQILRRHVIPNALPPLLTIIAFGFAGVILLESTISFLGIGLSAEEVTWGSMLSEARKNFSTWWLALFPGLSIFLMVVACNYLGDTLSEIKLISE